MLSPGSEDSGKGDLTRRGPKRVTLTFSVVIIIVSGDGPVVPHPHYVPAADGPPRQKQADNPVAIPREYL